MKPRWLGLQPVQKALLVGGEDGKGVSVVEVQMAEDLSAPHALCHDGIIGHAVEQRISQCGSHIFPRGRGSRKIIFGQQFGKAR
jgi:hypothetical protein